MSRRRSTRRASRLGLVLLAVAVVLLGGAVGNSGGGKAVAWAVAVALVAAGAHALIGKRSRPQRRRR